MGIETKVKDRVEQRLYDSLGVEICHFPFFFLPVKLTYRSKKSLHLHTYIIILLHIGQLTKLIFFFIFGEQ